jgi:hypothetical protein
MKKIKRILSLALASVMVLGLMVPTASALDISSSNKDNLTTYKDENGFWTKLPFDKILTVDPDMNIPTGTKFTFSMEPRDVTDEDVIDTIKVQKGTALTTSTVDITYQNSDLKDTSITAAVADSTNVTCTKTGVFDLPTFTKTGIYRYTVKEVVPAESDQQSYITYDTTDIYRVDLYVTTVAAADGTQKVGISSIVAVDINDPTKKDNIVFKNAIASAGLTIEKVIDGNGKDANDEFTFYIKIPEGGDNLTLSAGTSFDAVIHRTNGDEDKVTINVAGARDGNVVVNRSADGKTYSTTTDGAQAFTLKGGESITFTDLPIGMIFYVTEANYASDGYTTKVDYVATGDGANSASFSQGGDGGTQAKGTIASGSNTMTFTNKKELTPATGISVDFIPYVLVMVLAVAGCVLFVCKKKSNAR